MAALRVAVASGGIRAGPKTPFQEVMSKSGSPASAMEGVSGIRVERVRVLIARTRSLPAWMLESPAAISTNMQVTRPAITSVIAGGVLR